MCALIRYRSLLILLLWPSFSAFSAADAPLVELTDGQVQGHRLDKLYIFKGIPYAAPPVGANRWREPRPVKPWSEVLLADNYGTQCLQPSSWVGTDTVMGEDCLTLNVWTPALDSRRRPVMVWIHGGAFRAGSGMIQGEVLAREDVVVVSMNYRLGPLGFFAHPVLGDQPANFGLLDMIQSLTWVRDNIQAFGGDPDNITIFGISAGGMAVNLLMVNDTARELFHKAIAQSGYGTWALPRSRSAPEPSPLGMDLRLIQSAESIASKLVSEITSERPTRKSLRRIDGAKLVDAVQGFQLPIVDGRSLNEEPGLLFRRGHQQSVPFITGGNSYEGSVMAASGISIDEYRQSLGEDLDAALTLYQSDFAISMDQGFTRMFGDNRYLLSSRVLGSSMQQLNVPAWLYYTSFVPPDPPQPMPGAPHGFDGQLLFGAATAIESSQTALSANVRNYWLNFARTGDPNGPGLTPWPRYQPESDQWMEFGGKNQSRSGIIRAKLDLLERRYLKRFSK